MRSTHMSGCLIASFVILCAMQQLPAADARPASLYDALVSGSRQFLRAIELFDGGADDDDDEAGSYDATGDYLDRQQREPSPAGGRKPSRSTGEEEEQAGADEAQDRCTQPMRQGLCRALIPRWRYDMASKKCREFKYGGCDGNGNNFKSQRECEKICSAL